MGIGHGVLVVLLWTFLAAYFSGTETGMYSLNRYRVSVEAQAGGRDAVRLEALLARPADLIYTLLVGTNLCMYAATIQCTALAAGAVSWPHPMLAAMATTAVMSPVILVLAEMIPKEIFRRTDGRLMRASSRSLRIFVVFLSPLVILLRGMAFVVDTVLGTRQRKELFLSRQRLADLIALGADEGVIAPYQAEMAKKVMRLGGVKLESVMIPMGRVTMVEKNTAVGIFLDMARGRRHSRIPVFDRRRDRTVGIVNIFDIFYDPGRGRVAGDYVEPVIELGRDTTAVEALRVLQRAKRMMALVMEKDGSPAGVVTVKDLVEEIVGDLADW